MSGHVEPYGARELAKYLERIGGMALPSRGGGFVTFRMPSGREVKCPNPATRTPIPSMQARRIAEACGRTYQEMRAQLGHPIVKTSRPAAKQVAVRQTTKRDVLNRLRELQHQLTVIEQSVKPGVRDSEFYKSVLVALHEVGASLNRVQTGNDPRGRAATRDAAGASHFKETA